MRSDSPVGGGAAIERAVELEPDNGVVLWMSAFAFWLIGLDIQRSRELFSRSLAINPNYATAHHWYHEFLTAMGRVEEQIAEM